MPRAATTTDVFNAIAEPARRELLELVRGPGRAVDDLVAHTALSQPSVSKHLRVLKEVGLVQVRQEGRRRIYQADAAGLEPIHRWTALFADYWATGLQRIKRHAEREHVSRQ